MSTNIIKKSVTEPVKPTSDYFNQLMANTNVNSANNANSANSAKPAPSPRRKIRFYGIDDTNPSKPRTFLPENPILSGEPVLSEKLRNDPRNDPNYNARVKADVDRLSNQKDILDTISKTRLSNTNKHIADGVSSAPEPDPEPEPTVVEPAIQVEPNLTNTNKKGEEKIPNSLIIYIKTRIPNFYKMTYEPFMTVPESKSHTVYFDPLLY